MRKILLFGSLSSISANLRFIHSSNYSDLNFQCYCIFTDFEIVPPLNIFQVNLLCFKNFTTRIQRQIQNLPHEIKLTNFSLLNFITSLYIKSSISTSKSFSEALILASTNPQDDKRLFIELQVQYMKIASSEHAQNMLRTKVI